MKIRNIKNLFIGLTLLISFATPIALFTMKRPRPGEKTEEIPNITHHEDIQWFINQKFQQLPEIQDALTFLAEAPIVLEGDYEDQSNIFVATNGKVAATASEDSNLVNLWDISTGKQLIPIIAHPSNISSLAMNGDILVSGSEDGTVNISKTNGELLHTLTYPHSILSSVAIDANTIAIAFNKNIEIFSINNNTNKFLNAITNLVYPHSMAMKDNILTIIDGDIAKVWDINNRTMLFPIEDDEEIIKMIATNGKFIAVIVSDHNEKIDIYNINTRKVIHSFDQHGTNSIAIDNNKLVTGEDDSTKIWDINTNTLLKAINTPGDTVAIHDNIIVTAPYEGNPKIWSLDNPLKGTPDTNPFLWIINKATVPQLDLIKRACEATKADEELIITLPSADAKVFLSFPTTVREYLLARLKIRRPKV